MQKTAIVAIVLIVLAIFVVGIYYFLNNKVEVESPVYDFSSTEITEIENLAPEIDIGFTENPLADIPQINPLDNIPNPFDDDFVNPFE